MKRILALLLVALMLIGLCACGNGAQEGEQSAQGTDTSKAEANLSSNESILLSGYWIDKDEITFTFNKNGTAHIEGGDATPHDVKWTLEDDTVTCEWMGMVETFTLEKTDNSYTLTSYETVLSLVTGSSTEQKETSSKIEDSKTYKLGDTVSTDIIDFTLDRAELGIYLHDGTAGDRDEICLPAEDNKYIDNDCFIASVGHTLVSLQFTISNHNRTTTDISTNLTTRILPNGNETIRTSGLFVSVEYNGDTYEKLDCKTGLYPSNDGYDWGSVDNHIHVESGETKYYRCGVDFVVDVETLTDSFGIVFGIPTSTNELAKFKYIVTNDDIKSADAKRIDDLSPLDAASIFGYNDGYNYFLKHLGEYRELTTDEIKSDLINQTFNCYFKGKISHMEDIGTFNGNGEWEYDYKGTSYSIGYSIEDGILKIDASSDPFTGKIFKVNDSIYLMVNDNIPSGIIYK